MKVALDRKSPENYPFFDLKNQGEYAPEIIKISCTKNLTAGQIREMRATIQSGKFCLSICYLQNKKFVFPFAI
jgi:hypothetical protein